MTNLPWLPFIKPGFLEIFLSRDVNFLNNNRLSNYIIILMCSQSVIESVNADLRVAWIN